MEKYRVLVRVLTARFGRSCESLVRANLLILVICMINIDAKNLRYRFFAKRVRPQMTSTFQVKKIESRNFGKVITAT